ncbi:VanZ family protein [Paenibacillus sp. N1-5-1-14]|uniref:VanZ family protein n=1 Tax=Paenibacillus radicibacter TaxID=2972488 RepID=UPI0021594B0B|nr:VanZ family protein [Paenibacillus radicibacter]MCR8642687.1 VanZ family protein [Paenibacillus radicibacter]
MDTYFLPIRQAIITFPILAFIITLPFLIYQYHKYSYINWFRAVVLYSMMLFLLTALYLVILPLPDVRDTCSLQKPGTKHMSLIPFQFVHDFLKETKVNWGQPSTYLQIMKERGFLQVIFNFVLLLPLGIYLRYYFRQTWVKTLFFALGVSLFFEVTQLTGLYGIYTCPYRLFDIDDLMLNTAGAMLGFAITPLFTFFLPKSHQLDENVDFTARPVAFIRRLIAMQIDWIMMCILTPMLALSTSWFLPAYLFNASHTMTALLSLAIVFFLYFVVLPLRTGGFTLGKWILRIRLVGNHDRITFKELFTRYAILFGFIGIGPAIMSIFGGENSSGEVAIILVLLTFVIALFIVFDFIRSMFKRNRILFYERWSGTRNVIVPPKHKPSSADPAE